MDRSKLEKEGEFSLISHLSNLKRVQKEKEDSYERSNDGERDDERIKTGRNNYFKCEREGCNRTFYHVHVKAQSKNAEFEEKAGKSGKEEDEDW